MADHLLKGSSSLREALRQVPLFAHLSQEQLGCNLQGSEVWVQAGDKFVAEGDPLGDFYVLLAGKVEFTKKLGEQSVHVISFGPGAFFGHEPMLLGIPVPVTGHAVRPSHLFKLEEKAFWQMLSTCSSITRELLRTIAQRLQILESVSQEHGKLISLGTLSAGLAHELNNPAAAVSRGATNLGEVFQELPTLMLKLNQQLTPEQLGFLAHIQHDAIKRVKTMFQLDPLAQSDQEDEVSDWLELHGITDGWKLSPTLVGAGLGSQQLDLIEQQIPPDSVGDVLAWLEILLTGVGLLDEIKNGSSRISELVKAMKEYSLVVHYINVG